MKNLEDLKKKYYITTPIYYVNDAPHIGHAYTSVVSDVLSRNLRLQGLEVLFLTGTDEHGQKIEKAALSKGIEPLEFCDEVSSKFRALSSDFNLSNDDFIRTTETRHILGVQAFWEKLEKGGWIYKGFYKGWYAIRDEAFYTEEELVDGKAPTGAEVVWQEEESYFFRLSEFTEILSFIYALSFLYPEIPSMVFPASRLNEVKSFASQGLQDLSISRTSFKWGIPVPGDEKHVIYVWLDALTNYITALGYPNGQKYKDFWLSNASKIHIIGKDILRFHAIFWPAFLIAERYSLAQIRNVKSLPEIQNFLQAENFGGKKSGLSTSHAFTAAKEQISATQATPASGLRPPSATPHENPLNSYDIKDFLNNELLSSTLNQAESSPHPVPLPEGEGERKSLSKEDIDFSGKDIKNHEQFLKDEQLSINAKESSFQLHQTNDILPLITGINVPPLPLGEGRGEGLIQGESQSLKITNISQINVNTNISKSDSIEAEKYLVEIKSFFKDFKVVSHGWWKNNGEKMSKSLGNAINPYDLINEFGLDKVRYFFLKEMPFGSDGNFSRERFIELTNAELANNIGNLTQRVMSFIYTNCEEKIPNYSGNHEDFISSIFDFKYSYFNFQFNDAYKLENINKTSDALIKYFATIKKIYNGYFISENLSELDFRFSEAISVVLDTARSANEAIDKSAPWKLKKEGRLEEMGDVLHLLAIQILEIYKMLAPIMPESAIKGLKIFDGENIVPAASEIMQFSREEQAEMLAKLMKLEVKFGMKLNKPEPIFMRI